jgi:hypothetical protein
MQFLVLLNVVVDDVFEIMTFEFLFPDPEFDRGHFTTFIL